MAHEKNEPATKVGVPLGEVSQTAYRGSDRIANARAWLPFAAVLAVMGAWAAQYFGHGALRYTPGPLANVHATWDDQCAVCHQSSAPLSGNNWAAALTGHTHAADDQCTTCHPGPSHHRHAKPHDVPGCATCHREHHGRQAALVRVADAFCRTCHRDLPNHRIKAGDGDAVHDVVTAFNVREHPDFWDDREKKDPGTVAFNHKRHLSRGLSLANDAAAFTLAQIPQAFRDQYRRPDQADAAAVQLDCMSCHTGDARDARINGQPLAGLPQNAVVPVRRDGAYMQPILYERHCQGCHPLTIKRTLKSGVLAGDVTVRHRMQPAELKEVLRGYYTELFLKGSLEVSPAILKIPLPGKDPAADAARRTAEAMIAQHVEEDTRILLSANTCQKCHPSLARDRERIPPADIPQVWFGRAKFDHAAHRAVACVECHGEAQESQVHTDVLLPAIGTCVKCHAPPSRRGDQVSGGARFDCVECHRYHNGDHPLQGTGAAARQPANRKKLDIERFLSPNP